jgi:hypothetical protein
MGRFPLRVQIRDTGFGAGVIVPSLPTSNGRRHDDRE